MSAISDALNVLSEIGLPPQQFSIAFRTHKFYNFNSTFKF